jgi:hypothetical protein
LKMVACSNYSYEATTQSQILSSETLSSQIIATAPD